MPVWPILMRRILAAKSEAGSVAAAMPAATDRVNSRRLMSCFNVASSGIRIQKTRRFWLSLIFSGGTPGTDDTSCQVLKSPFCARYCTMASASAWVSPSADLSSSALAIFTLILPDASAGAGAGLALDASGLPAEEEGSAGAAVDAAGGLFGLGP